jgi:SAM-dependent methyltransferase
MNHYNDEYFAWQQSIGKFGGKVETFKFKPFINQKDNVIDFGCGGAYILENLKADQKIGIEINEFARNAAIKRDLNVVDSIEKINDEWADVIISHHALEHTHHPLNLLIDLKPKLKKGGIIIIVVPHELKDNFEEDDIKQHLYTWSPQSLGNLLKLAGYKILQAESIKHRWPPKSEMIYKLFGAKIFHLVCLLYSRVRRVAWQTRVIALNDY